MNTIRADQGRSMSPSQDCSPSDLDSFEKFDYRKELDDQDDQSDFSDEADASMNRIDAVPRAQSMPAPATDALRQGDSPHPHLRAVSSSPLREASMLTPFRRGMIENMVSEDDIGYYSPRNRPSLHRQPIRSISNASTQHAETSRPRPLARNSVQRTESPASASQDQARAATGRTYSREAELEEEIRLYSDQNLALGRQIRDAESSRQDMLKELETDRQSHEMTIEGLKRESTIRERELKNAKKRQKQAEETCDQLSQEVRDLTEASRATDAEVTQLRHQVNQKSRVVEELQRALSDQKNSLQRLQDQANEYERCTSELRKEDQLTMEQVLLLERSLRNVEAQDQQIRVLEKEDRALKDRVRHLEDQLSKSVSAEKAIQDEMSRLGHLNADETEMDAVMGDDETRLDKPAISTAALPQSPTTFFADTAEIGKNASTSLFPPSSLIGRLFLSRLLPLLLLVWFSLIRLQDTVPPAVFAEELSYRNMYYGTDKHPSWLQSIWYMVDSWLGHFDTIAGSSSCPSAVS